MVYLDMVEMKTKIGDEEEKIVVYQYIDLNLGDGSGIVPSSSF